MVKTNFGLVFYKLYNFLGSSIGRAVADELRVTGSSPVLESIKMRPLCVIGVPKRSIKLKV